MAFASARFELPANILISSFTDLSTLFPASWAGRSRTFAAGSKVRCLTSLATAQDAQPLRRPDPRESGMLVFATRDVNRGARDCRRRSGVAQGPSVLAFERAAHVAARRAGALIRARYGERQQVSFKSEVDLVTTVDREAERLILDTLKAAFPDHGMIAEESTASPGRDGHRWYVDP